LLVFVSNFETDGQPYLREVAHELIKTNSRTSDRRAENLFFILRIFNKTVKQIIYFIKLSKNYKKHPLN